MSDEKTYKPSEIVWVKLSGCWWPGEVQNVEDLPEEVKEDVDDSCLAVVKFFDEDYYEPIYNKKEIYSYNCPEKQDFIEKGMARYRSKMKDGSNILKKLPEDLKKAEEITGGSAEIIDQLMTATKPPKISYDEIFSSSGTKRKTPIQKGEVTPKPAKKARGEPAEAKTPLIAHVASSVREKPKTPKATTPKAKTTPTAKKPAGKTTEPTSGSGFQCEFCSFNTNRLNLIILHRKSHSDGVLPVEKKQEVVEETPKKGRSKAKDKTEVQSPSTGVPPGESAFDSLVGNSTKKLSVAVSEPKKRPRKNGSPQRMTSSPKSTSQPTTPQKPPPKKKVTSPSKSTSLLAEFSKKRPSPNKKLIQDPAKSAEIKSKLLADWDDDEMGTPEKEPEKLAEGQKAESDDENGVTENVLLSTRSDDEDDDIYASKDKNEEKNEEKAKQLEEEREKDVKELENQIDNLLESTTVPEIPSIEKVENTDPEEDVKSPVHIKEPEPPVSETAGPKIIAATETEPATHPTESILDTSHLQPVHKTIPVPADFTSTETTTVTSVSTIASTQEGASEAVIQQELAVPPPQLVLSQAVVLQDGQIVAQAPTDINGETYVFVALDDADTANLNGATFVAYADSQDASEQTFFVESDSLGQAIGGAVLGVTSGIGSTEAKE